MYADAGISKGIVVLPFFAMLFFSKNKKSHNFFVGFHNVFSEKLLQNNIANAVNIFVC